MGVGHWGFGVKNRTQGWGIRPSLEGVSEGIEPSILSRFKSVRHHPVCGDLVGVGPKILTNFLHAEQTAFFKIFLKYF